MRLEFRDSGEDLDHSGREQLESRLRIALGRFGQQVESVTLRCSAAGSFGGRELCRCRITVRLVQGAVVLVEGLDASAMIAAKRATLRLGPAVTRRLAHAAPSLRILAQEPHRPRKN